MRLFLGAILAAAVLAQDPASGVFRGVLIERDTGPAGEFAVRAADNQVVRVHYDARTWAERDEQRIAVSDLRPGDPIQIVSDRGAGPNARYARFVRVIPTTLATRPRPTRPRAPGSWRTPLIEELFPRGNLTFAGTIAEVDTEGLLLRTRDKGPMRILLREDTRLLQNGGPGAMSDLQINSHVFVRAGKNLDGDIEAYQIIWGPILNPHQ